MQSKNIKMKSENKEKKQLRKRNHNFEILKFISFYVFCGRNQ